jgi:ELWxxDGT repeat protein
MANASGILYFSANGPGGRELWKSDGTAAGTRRVKDLRLGPKGSNPDQIISLGSTVYFAAFDKAFGERQVWRSDGTSAGTHPLNGSEFYRSPRTLTRVGNLVYFLGDSSGCAPSTYLLRTNGTNAGTRIVTYANGEENYGDGLPALSFKNRLFLVEYGRLEKVNQAGNGLVTVKSFDDPAINGYGHVVGLHRMGSTLYLMVDVLVDDEWVAYRQLWKTDGTASGTQSVFLWDPMYVDPVMTSVGGELFFWSQGSNGPDIWRSDGTNAGTMLAAEIHAPFEQHLTPSGSSIYFSHDDGVHGRELWRVTP